MPDTTEHVRIYCICGQKMKVSESMFGHPGKCVACRQKIRIPRADEIPEDVSEIYLKDHPEFLRKSILRRKRKTPVPKKGKAGERAAKEPEVKGTLAIDVLPPLRVLASLEAKLQRRLDALSRYEADKAPGTAETDRAALLGRQARIISARTELDEQLRQRQVEVTIESSNLQEKIVAAELGVRVGEMNFDTYRVEVERLRQLRDLQERRKQNLAGWLETRDPYQAGGYIEVSEDELPKWAGRLALPEELERAQTRLNLHIDSLRRALADRELSERKLDEARRMRGAMPDASPAIEEAELEATAAKQRAEVAVSFFRRRLEQLDKDYANDIEAVQAQIDLARGRLQVNELNRPQFAVLERNLLRAKADALKARDVVARALTATSARDVPYPQGTFLQRLARPVAEEGIGTDSYILCGAAALLLALIFLPLFGNYSPIVALFNISGETATLLWVLSGPVLFAFALLLVAFNRARESRGLLTCGIWVVATILGAITLREIAAYNPGPLGNRLREAGPWLLRPAVIAAVLASAGMAVAALVALVREKRLLKIVYACAGLVVLALILVHTDVFYFFRPVPHISYTIGPFNERAGAYDVTVDIRNSGTRRLYLTELPPPDLATSVRTAFSVDLVRQGGTSSAYSEHTPALGTTLGDLQVNAIPPGGQKALHYSLPPGQYRMTLESPMLGMTRTTEFPLPLPTAPTARRRTETEEQVAVAPANADDTESSVRRLLLGVEAELRGIVTSAGHDPKFSLNLYMPDGKVQPCDVGLTDPVYKDWKIAEFNPSAQTVTLSDDSAILILRRGERTLLGTM